MQAFATDQCRVINAMFHSNSRINQILPQIIHILRFFVRLAAPYFKINVLRSGHFMRQISGSSYKSLTLLHFWTGSSEWCTECQGRQSSRKR